VALRSIPWSRHGDAYTLNTILDIYLSNLHSHLIPTKIDIEARRPSALENAERGLDSVFGLGLLLNFVMDDPNHRSRPSAVHKTVQMMDNVCRWLTFATSHSTRQYLSERNFAHTNILLGECSSTVQHLSHSNRGTHARSKKL
jgi:hypothetical protein